MKYQAKLSLTLTNKLYEKLGYSITDRPKGKKILVIRDVCTALYSAIENVVAFVTDDEEARNLFARNVVGNGQFGNDDKVVFIDTAEKKMKEAWLEGIDEVTKDMKFDICIMNPPYDRGLYVSVISKALAASDKLVSINPAHQFFDWINLIQLKPRIKSNPNVLNNIVDFELLDCGTPVFEWVSLDNLLCILHYDKSTAGIDYKSFNLVKPQYRSIFYKTVYKFFKGLVPSLHKEILKSTSETYKLPIPRVHGHVNCKDWTEITSSNYERSINAKLTNDWHVSFKSDIERRNCFDVWHMSKVHNFIHLIVKDCIFNYTQCLPWLVDYSQPWTDKRLCKFFNITGYISDTEAEPDSEWEIILNTIK